MNRHLLVAAAMGALAIGCQTPPAPQNQPPEQGTEPAGPAELVTAETEAQASWWRCRWGTLSASVASPQPVGTPIELTADPGCHTPTDYQFAYRTVVKNQPGRWTELRSWGPSTFAWNTSGMQAGNYQVASRSRYDRGYNRTIYYELTNPSCPAGYQRDSSGACVDIDECSTDNGGCDPLTTCTNLPGSRACGPCPSGYTGTGESACQDIDECAEDNGGCDPITTCTNVPGGRTCGPCPSGFIGAGETGCIDINECEIGNGGCDPLTTCTNTPGSRTCGPCPSGYTGTGDTACADVNECLTANGGCDPLTTCTNTPGGRTCGPCPSGYTGTGDTACLPINPCADNPCRNGGTCTSTADGFTCECRTGWAGTTCEQSVPVPLLAVGDIGDCNSTATAQATALIADQYPGTIAVLGDTNQMVGGTLDEYMRCFDSVWGRHKGRIRPVPGNHDYMGAGLSAGYLTYYGSVAGTSEKTYYSYDLGTWHIIALDDNCDSSPVTGGCAAGSVQEQWLRQDLAAHQSFCTLAYFHQGRYSSGLHGNTAAAAPLWQALLDHGVEIALSGHDHGYERWKPQDNAGKESPGGIVQFVVGTGGTTLRSFASSTPPPNSDVRDNATHGLLSLSLRDGGYDWRFIPVDGKTFGDQGSAECHVPCPAGYRSVGRACVDINECESNNGGCDPATTCTNIDGGRTCGPCPQGYSGTGETGCTDIDECAANHGGCDVLTTCTNTPGGHVCGTCPSGYTGTGETGCLDIDECATNNGGCVDGRSCMNTQGGRTCGPCPTGYLEQGATGCVWNYCASVSGLCDPLTTCQNTQQGPVCTACPQGYTGTGETGCADIDECAANNGGCDALTTCTNVAGGRTCGPCPSGYTGTGETGCIASTACTFDNGGCDPLTTCTPTADGRICGACPSGYEGTGDSFCMLPFLATEMVGTPTNDSITITAVAGQAIEAYFDVGTAPGIYRDEKTYVQAPDGMIQARIGGLAPSTRYYYRMLYRPQGSRVPYRSGSEHTFQTQRAPSESFAFAVQSDSHQGYQSFYNDELYRTTMANIAGGSPDFLIDLGDFVSTDDASETQASVRQKYLNQRKVVGLAAHSMPVFLAIGNHENEEGWNLDDMGSDRQSSLPVLGVNARKRYFMNPVPDSFYSGNLDPLPEIDGDHLRADYYAFTWGDALFAVIDPYWYTMKKPFTGSMGGEKDDETVGNRWDWTLGKQQYDWLRDTLTSSTAKFKFVFAHHMVGGTSDYVRAGTIGAKYCEWGGYDTDGTTWSFPTRRPGWDMPIHQLFVATNVTAFFHGHDHVFAREELDGVAYIEVPHAANADYGSGFDTNPTDYAGAVLINNSGHVRMTVTGDRASLAYVRSYLPGAGTNGEVAYTVDMLPCTSRDDDADGANNCIDGCRNDANKQQPGLCGCGRPDVDTDGDGTADCKDQCPADPAKAVTGACGCGRPESAGCCMNDQCIPTTFMNVRVGVPGPGSVPLTTTSTAAFIEERSMSDGALVATYPLPVAAQGQNKPLTVAGSAYIEGTLKSSRDGHWVTIAGYATGPGVEKVAQKKASEVSRVVARMGVDRAIDSSTVVTGAFNGGTSGNGNPRAVISATGAEYWVVGTSNSSSVTGGIWYGTFGNSTPVQIIGQSGNNPSDVRFCDILGDQLYASTAASSMYGVFTVGALPTARATATLLSGFPTTSGPGPMDFAILDRDEAIPGADTIYLSDDRAVASGGGVQKWTFNGTTWTLTRTLTAGLPTGVRHLAAFEMGDTVVLLATTTSTPNAIIRMFDGSDATAQIVVSAAENTFFRGISAPPSP